MKQTEKGTYRKILKKLSLLDIVQTELFTHFYVEYQKRL